MRRTSKTTAVVAALVLALIGAACGSSSPAAKNSKSGSASPITLGFISSQTGGASSSYVDAQWGAQARLDAQNASGGVNGHQLRLVMKDDQSSPTGNQTDAQDLVQNEGAIGVIDDSSFTFGSARYLNQAGIPVTGAAIDGPEWGQLSNMFSLLVPSFTPIGGKYYTYTDTANIMKMLGVQRLAGIAYNIQSAIQAISSNFQAASTLGLVRCYQNGSIPFGDMDFGAVALSMKSAGCQGAYVPMLLASDIALSSALKNAGVPSKLLFAGTGYDQNLLSEPGALASMAGQYTTAEVDLTNPNAASQVMLDNLKKYTGYKTGIPNLNIVFGYLAADLMIQGLNMAGGSPTSKDVIAKLRTVGSYSAGGILASPVTYQHFGTVDMFPATQCEPAFQITATGYAPLNGGKPICGTRVATNAA